MSLEFEAFKSMIEAKLGGPAPSPGSWAATKRSGGALANVAQKSNRAKEARKAGGTLALSNQRIKNQNMQNLLAQKTGALTGQNPKSLTGHYSGQGQLADVAKYGRQNSQVPSGFIEAFAQALEAKNFDSSNALTEGLRTGNLLNP